MSCRASISLAGEEESLAAQHLTGCLQSAGTKRKAQNPASNGA